MGNSRKEGEVVMVAEVELLLHPRIKVGVRNVPAADTLGPAGGAGGEGEGANIIGADFHIGIGGGHLRQGLIQVVGIQGVQIGDDLHLLVNVFLHIGHQQASLLEGDESLGLCHLQVDDLPLGWVGRIWKKKKMKSEK